MSTLRGKRKIFYQSLLRPWERANIQSHPVLAFLSHPKAMGSWETFGKTTVQGQSKGLKFNEIIKNCSSPYLTTLGQVFYLALGRQQRKTVFVELHWRELIPYIYHTTVFYLILLFILFKNILCKEKSPREVKFFLCVWILHR